MFVIGMVMMRMIVICMIVFANGIAIVLRRSMRVPCRMGTMAMKWAIVIAPGMGMFFSRWCSSMRRQR